MKKKKNLIRRPFLGLFQTSQGMLDVSAKQSQNVRFV